MRGQRLRSAGRPRCPLRPALLRAGASGEECLQEEGPTGMRDRNTMGLRSSCCPQGIPEDPKCVGCGPSPNTQGNTTSGPIAVRRPVRLPPNVDKFKAQASLVRPPSGPALLRSSFKHSVKPRDPSGSPRGRSRGTCSHCSHPSTHVTCDAYDTREGRWCAPVNAWLAGSPVLGPAVVQPAGPAGEAEQGVEGTLHAVQRALCRQQTRGRRQPLRGGCKPILRGS